MDLYEGENLVAAGVEVTELPMEGGEATTARDPILRIVAPVCSPFELNRTFRLVDGDDFTKVVIIHASLDSAGAILLADRVPPS